MSTLVEVADYSFDAEVLKIDIPVVAVFWAEWNASSKNLAAELQGLAELYGERIKLVKLDIDQSPNVASTYNVLNLPTIIIFKFALPVERLTGSQTQAQIEEKLLPYLDE